mmetsp:Transcript_26580/g.50222  ORF Transcript_26580/g.50222 Transcript_26580/m.50222 type:complete len:254 (-) Transcript_26580:568-1329(-)
MHGPLGGPAGGGGGGGAGVGGHEARGHLLPRRHQLHSAHVLRELGGDLNGVPCQHLAAAAAFRPRSHVHHNRAAEPDGEGGGAVARRAHGVAEAVLHHAHLGDESGGRRRLALRDAAGALPRAGERLHVCDHAALVLHDAQTQARPLLPPHNLAHLGGGRNEDAGRRHLVGGHHANGDDVPGNHRHGVLIGRGHGRGHEGGGGLGRAPPPLLHVVQRRSPGRHGGEGLVLGAGRPVGVQGQVVRLGQERADLR